MATWRLPIRCTIQRISSGISPQRFLGRDARGQIE